MADVKTSVIRALKEMALSLKLEGANAFRIQAYEQAARQLAGVSEDRLLELVRTGRLTTLVGIGPSLAEHVTELVNTGQLTGLEELTERYPDELRALVRLPSIGPRRALALWEALGTADPAALVEACQQGRVREIPGFGRNSEQTLLASLQQLLGEGLTDRRPLAEVLPEAERLLAYVQQGPGVVRASLAGSVRRFAETVGDVDLVASAPRARAVLDHFTRWPDVVKVRGSGESLASVILDSGLQVDLRVVRDADFATALHHFTGSKAHNVRLRTLARRKGLTLSEWGLHDLKGRKKRVTDEDGLYALLGLPFIPPELREDTGEIQAALAGDLPDDLVTEKDVLGIVHSHSTWSDGRSSLREMALAARSLGMQYLTVTEHSQTAGYAGGLTPADVRRQWREIDALNRELGPHFRLLKGIESDILEDGRLDLPDAMLTQLDLVIASIHARHGMDGARMTHRVLTAMDHPRMDILGHPTGRLILRRPPYDLEMKRVLERARQTGVVLEVNGNPNRLDLSGAHVREAMDRGVRLCLSCDSHSTAELGHLRFAVATARRGWARRSAVVNTLPAADFVSTLRGNHP